MPMLSTLDNPYNPYTHYDDWDAFDQAQGYFTPAYLSRTIDTLMGDDEADQPDTITDAIAIIMEHNVLGIYVVIDGPNTKVRPRLLHK